MQEKDPDLNTFSVWGCKTCYMVDQKEPDIGWVWTDVGSCEL